MRKCENCNNPAAKHRKICNTCKSRAYINKNRPLMVWHWIKKSAKRRGIYFDLNKEQFIKLIIDSGYIKGSGRLRDSLTIDRINPDKGYIMENLQVVTKSFNSSKYHSEEKHFPF